MLIFVITPQKVLLLTAWGYWTECHQNCTQRREIHSANLFKLQLRYCNLFPNGHTTKETGLQKMPIFLI